MVRNVDDGINKVYDMTSWDWDGLRNSRANTPNELGNSLADGWIVRERASKAEIAFSRVGFSFVSSRTMGGKDPLILVCGLNDVEEDKGREG